MRIVITPLIAGKPWTGSTIYESALGGSEAAVAYLAREFARRDHEVTVFTHGQPGVFEKVTYKHVQTLGLTGVPECDVHISSRWVDILKESRSPRTLRVLWLHDMPPSGQMQTNAHLAVCLSVTHASAWGKAWYDQELESWVAAGDTEIIGDGVDLTLFTGRERRAENRLLWVSNPDRGLYLACKIFREHVLPRWPMLKLDVFGRYSVYGWPPATERPYLPPKEWLEEGWLSLRDPLPRIGLARELMRSWAVFYPTYWPETFCMATIEAQAAGTPVITCPVGALTETVKGGIIGYDIVNAVSQLRNKGRWRKLSLAGQEHAAHYSWPEIARQWEQAITKRTGTLGAI